MRSPWGHPLQELCSKSCNRGEPPDAMTRDLDSQRDLELAILLAQAQKGDVDAYERFLREASTIARAFLARRIESDDVVEDVLQETLISIHQARHSYLPGRPLGPWLYAICEHRTSDHFRRHRRTVSREVALIEAEALSEPPCERGSPFQSALAKLPEKQRRVIELLKVKDLSVKEVAAETGMSESAVKVTAFRGYEAMRRLFGVGPR